MAGDAPSEEAPCPPLSIRELVEISSHVDLRIGRMVSVEKHPSADKLYIEQVDFGSELGIRTVVSGLVPYFAPEQIQGKLCVFVANLKPASMRGVKSHAMVLVAHGSCGTIEFLEPPSDAPLGARAVFCLPHPDEALGSAVPDSVLNPKKKHWETIQPAIAVNAATKSVVLKAADGSEAVLCCDAKPIICPTVTSGVIS